MSFVETGLREKGICFSIKTQAHFLSWIINYSPAKCNTTALHPCLGTQLQKWQVCVSSRMVICKLRGDLNFPVKQSTFSFVLALSVDISIGTSKGTSKKELLFWTWGNMFRNSNRAFPSLHPFTKILVKFKCRNSLSNKLASLRLCATSEIIHYLKTVSKFIRRSSCSCSLQYIMLKPKRSISSQLFYQAPK